MKKIFSSTLSLAAGILLAIPLFARAQGGVNINVLKPYSDSIIGIINLILVPVLIAIAFIVFLWGVYKYFIYHGENESEKMEGRKYAMWGIIGFVVIVSVWGLVNIVRSAVNLTNTNAPPYPTIGPSTGTTNSQPPASDSQPDNLPPGSVAI